MGSKTPWHEGLSREELVERCEQFAKQSNRNNEAANRDWHQVDDLQKRICKADKRCAAHSYVQELELLCRDMYKALEKVAANLETLVGQPMRILTDESAEKTRRDLDCCKERMDALGLLEVEQ